MRSFGRALALLVALLAMPGAASYAQSSAQVADLYQQARARETELRKEVDATPASSAAAPALLKQMRTLSKTYEDLWRLFPPNGYTDNAIWQAAMLSADAFWEFGEATDRARALKLFQALTANYPTSSLVKQVPAQVTRLESAKSATTATNAPSKSPAPAPAPAPAPPLAPAKVTSPPSIAPTTLLKSIRREALPDALRVTLELEQEPVFHAERIEGPPRVFIDLQNTRAVDALKDATIPYTDDLVRQIRVGRQIDARIRVVLDLSVTAGHYSVYSLYNPFRIVIDFERKAAAPPPPAATPAPSLQAAAVAEPPKAEAPKPAEKLIAKPVEKVAEKTDQADKPQPDATWPAPPATPPPPPAAPSTNATGSFSLSRQLGLGIQRIVIDAGHGGHDPGAQVKGLNEADLTLDIALRLEKLFQKNSTVEVVLTRRNDTYIQLEERTAIANRAGSDLFLSIHANASAVPAARGIETYFLNFAPNPEAEAIAARENAGAARTMRNLPDIVKAIALNNKIDESRDFAGAVQAAMFEKLRPQNKTLRNLGVKQAPFMVLIGATMPSVLAEISFITNKDEGALLKTDKYRQQIAEALYQGVMKYQQSLKKTPAIASTR